MSVSFQNSLQPYIVRNDFAKISKNLVRYKFENNFVEPKQLCRKLKHDDQCCKKFLYSSKQFGRPT